ncbi:hypothetical protein BRX37_11660 [Sphingomonas sp. S-NIH.Pt3_0716]|nr:hypothetical protein BRX37_11660 [Sphingomonas sp. S-NIH.Pt3_0716]
MRPSHQRHAELVSASIKPNKPLVYWEKWTLKQVQGDDDRMAKTGRQPSNPDIVIASLRLQCRGSLASRPSFLLGIFLVHPVGWNWPLLSLPHRPHCHSPPQPPCRVLVA